MLTTLYMYTLYQINVDLFLLCLQVAFSVLSWILAYFVVFEESSK